MMSFKDDRLPCMIPLENSSKRYTESISNDNEYLDSIKNEYLYLFKGI